MYTANLSCVANDGATAGENTGQGNKEKRGSQPQTRDERKKTDYNESSLHKKTMG